MVAQLVLEKAITLNLNYGQALGLLATSYMFSARMGWAEIHGGGTYGGNAAAFDGIHTQQ